jgi:hypothetical protein
VPLAAAVASRPARLSGHVLEASGWRGVCGYGLLIAGSKHGNLIGIRLVFSSFPLGRQVGISVLTTVQITF